MPHYEIVHTENGLEANSVQVHPPLPSDREAIREHREEKARIRENRPHEALDGPPSQQPVNQTASDKPEDAQVEKVPVPACPDCGFKAVTLAGFRAHQRKHAAVA
jgi:hypothetical protein